MSDERGSHLSREELEDMLEELQDDLRDTLVDAANHMKRMHGGNVASSCHQCMNNASAVKAARALIYEIQAKLGL